MANTPIESWRPLSARIDGRPLDSSWHEGVPAWIDKSLRDWLEKQLYIHNTFERICARFQYDRADNPSQLVREIDARTLLDWIDTALHVAADYDMTFAPHVRPLEILLREGRSVWTVNEGQDGLERRQDEIVTKTVGKSSDSAIEAGAEAASVRLKEAWEAVYGLHPDPSKGYGKAILAVEGVAVPKILPNQPSATLGHVLGQLDRQGHLYEVAITDKSGAPAPTTPAVGLIRLLWEGHTDRHEGNIPAIPITQESAEMALHLAATLVQWFSTDAIRRR